MKMTFYVLFIRGPAAAGKHTIGSLVSERLELPLFHNHLTVDLARTLFEFGTPAFVALRAHIWRAAFHAAAAERRSFIFTFNPESPVDPALMEELAETISSASGRVFYVELVCSDEEVVRRIDSPSRHRFGKLTDATVYRAAKAQGRFEVPALPEALARIDTEAGTPQASSEMIVRALERVSI